MPRRSFVGESKSHAALDLIAKHREANRRRERISNTNHRAVIEKCVRIAGVRALRETLVGARDRIFREPLRVALQRVRGGGEVLLRGGHLHQMVYYPAH